ncbi:MAG: hypothetical protein HRU17_22320 [Polyangiaceae bacterium]|nr:hypothetical protein [Polyangiaceae bacterium]
MRLQRLYTASAVLALCTLSGLASADEVEITESARAHFRAGVNMLQDPDGAQYELAYQEFQAAYRDSPSWKILGNLGIAAMKLERYGDATEAFEKYLSGGGMALDPVDRAQYQRDLQTLKTSVVTVTLTVVPPGARILDERIPSRGAAILNRYKLQDDGTKTLGIRPGHHRLTIRSAGYNAHVWEFDATSGDKLSHEVVLKSEDAGAAATAPVAAAPEAATPAPAPVATERPVPTSVFIGLAATGVFAVGGGIVGVMAMGKNSDFQDANSGDDPAAAEELRDSGTMLNLIADGMLAGAVIAGAVTTYLYMDRPEVSVPKDSAKFRVLPSVTAGGAGLWLNAQF